jgi:SAM-dependent methyltransferase
VTTLEEAPALVERMFGSLLGALEVATVHLGLKLGLYRALTTPRTAAELAAEAGIDKRYAREWLEQQAIAGLVTVAEDGDAETRRYHLTPGQAAAFADESSPYYAGSMALLVSGLGAVLPSLPEVFRSGAGVPFGAYGDDVRLGQGLFNRDAFLQQLADEWVPALPGVADLLARPGAHALDLGSGVGYSSIALAKAWPGLEVLGVDSDDASVMDARANADAAGVADRVRFEVADADKLPDGTSYDVAFYFEALHDMAHPVESLRAVRESLRPGGVVVVMEERAEEEFAPGGHEVERLLGAASVLHCLPVGLSQPGSEGTGAMFRPATMRDYAARAGYAETGVAPIEHDLFRFYVLTP